MELPDDAALCLLIMPASTKLPQAAAMAKLLYIMINCTTTTANNVTCPMYKTLCCKVEEANGVPVPEAGRGRSFVGIAQICSSCIARASSASACIQRCKKQAAQYCIWLYF